MARVKGVSAGVAVVVMTVVIANLGNGIVAPLMPSLKEHFGSTAAQVSLMASGYGLGRLLMDLPAGFFSDKFGPSRLFTVGILISGAAAAFAAFSTTLDQLIFFRTLMGCGSSIMSTVALTLLARIAPPGQRGAVLGFYTSAMLLGQAVSPTIGGYLGTAFDWRAAFIFCALTPFISFPMNLFITSKSDAVQAVRPEEREKGRPDAGREKREKAATGGVNWPALITVYVGTFVNFFNRHGMRQSVLPLYAGMVLGLDASFIGAVLTIGAVVTIVINIPSGSIADRIGKKRLLIPGLLTLVLGNLCLLLGDTSSLVFIISMVLISMGVLSNGMLTALVADLVPEPLMSRGMGAYRFTADLGALLGPFVLGLLVDAFGFSAALVIGACVVLAGTASVSLFVPSRTGVAAEKQTA